MNLLVFSDLHGLILAPFKLAKCLEAERHIKIDFILQCGDAGIFPDLSKLDRATIKHFKSDISETGFHEYFTNYQPEVKKLLDSVNCPMICVRGNHEDHSYLDVLEQNSNDPYFPVDYYKRIYVIKSGEIFRLEKKSENIKILGIGRIGSSDKKTSQRFIQNYERTKLNNIPENSSFDILISHDSAIDFVTHSFGMLEIRDILNRFEPLYHFYGHTGTPFTQKIDDNGFTTSIKVAELRSTNESKLSEGSMILLQWGNYNQNKLEVINDEWYKGYDLTESFST